MSRPGRHGSLQREHHLRHKKHHRLICQTLTTPNGLSFFLYGLEAGRRHDLMLNRDSHWEYTFSKYLSVVEEFSYVIEDNLAISCHRDSPSRGSAHPIACRRWRPLPQFRKISCLYYQSLCVCNKGLDICREVPSQIVCAF